MSQIESSSQLLGKINLVKINVPNHQPNILIIVYYHKLQYITRIIDHQDKL